MVRRKNEKFMFLSNKNNIYGQKVQVKENCIKRAKMLDQFQQNKMQCVRIIEMETA